MGSRDLTALLALSALWGGSFLFIRIAAPVLGPVVLMELRVLLAGLALLLYARICGANMEFRQRWRQYAMIGLLNSAIPFTLIATAAVYLSASFASILNATSPLFGAMVATIWIKEVITPRKLAGLMLGISGVSLAVGFKAETFAPELLFSIGASVLGAFFYGLAGVYTRIYCKGASAVGIATCSQLSAAVFLLPLIPFVPVRSDITPEVVFSVAALSLFSTALAYLLYFGLIKNVGPTRALTVTFLSPVFGIFWGVLILGESISLTTLFSFGVILAGTGLVTGLKIRVRRSRSLSSPEKAIEA